MVGFDSWNDELYHYGILGQKWGIRRFQNNDGSLTPAGKKRYVQDMTDDELKKNIKRLELERQYKDLKRNGGLRRAIDTAYKFYSEKNRAKEAKKEQELKDKELNIRRIESENRAKTAKEDRKRAEQNTKNSEWLAKREETTLSEMRSMSGRRKAKAELLRVKNEKTKMSIVRRAVRFNSDERKKYVDSLINSSDNNKKKDKKDED